jgi:hypothetical protein
MKNIHIISTDKPSRLVFDVEENRLLPLQAEDFWMKHQDLMQNKNIYITNDEEIREGYVKHIEYGICRVISIKPAFIQCETSSGIKMLHPVHCKKVILTTDPTLIADGVQAIDDTFLEWFVNNTSCEKVEVDRKTPDEIEIELNIHGHDIGLSNTEFDEWLKNGGKLYKIIIPQEKSKTFGDSLENSANIISIANYMFGKKEEPKQEILEEVAEKYSKKSSANMFQENHKKDFIAGAKWQSERMYSEEEVRKIAWESRLFFNRNRDIPFSKIKGSFFGWFEQFKKK